MPKLTGRQREFLMYGPRDDGDDGFTTEAEVLAAWAEHRADLMRQTAGGGRRPWAWRAIDFPRVRWRGYDRERSINYAAGVLSEAERTELNAEWRKAFDEAQQLDPDARQKALAAADVPKSLQREWAAELRARQKAGRRPQASGAVRETTSDRAEGAVSSK